MKLMKLKPIHLILILLASIILCCCGAYCLGVSNVENFDNKDKDEYKCEMTDKTYDEGARCIGDEITRKSRHHCCNDYGKSKNLVWNISDDKESKPDHMKPKPDHMKPKSRDMDNVTFIDEDEASFDEHAEYNKNKNELDEQYNSMSKFVVTPRGDKILATPENTMNGVRKNRIPKGQEDLYILKSEVVPPVCPACPNVTACPRNEPAPPCPPCARCPEPAFDCKKVPNYNSTNTNYLPRPMLNDFSQFGM